MAKQQRRPLAPPLETDKLFRDYTAVIQNNLDDLFNDAHTHTIRTSIPLPTDGIVGDIVVVNLTGTYYIYVKVDNTVWKKTAALS
jgi:hypothetical protein